MTAYRRSRPLRPLGSPTRYRPRRSRRRRLRSHRDGPRRGRLRAGPRGRRSDLSARARSAPGDPGARGASPRGVGNAAHRAGARRGGRWRSRAVLLPQHVRRGAARKSVASTLPTRHSTTTCHSSSPPGASRCFAAGPEPGHNGRFRTLRCLEPLHEIWRFLVFARLGAGSGHIFQSCTGHRTNACQRSGGLLGSGDDTVHALALDPADAASAYVVPLVADTDQAICRAYGVPVKAGYASRVSFLIGPDGKILFIDKAAVATVLRGAAVRPSSNRLSRDPLPFSFPDDCLWFGPARASSSRCSSASPPTRARSSSSPSSAS